LYILSRLTHILLLNILNYRYLISRCTGGDSWVSGVMSLVERGVRAQKVGGGNERRISP